MNRPPRGAKRDGKGTTRRKKPRPAGNGHTDLIRQLWEAAVNLRGTSVAVEQIAANVEQSRTLAELRDMLLPKLLSGEIRVREAEKVLEQAGACHRGC